MKSFTIKNETNDISVHATKREATSVPNSESFRSIEELTALSANWPASRLIEIWNSLPGESPVKKFTDRKRAATRIWKAIRSLGESVVSEAAPEQNPEPQAKTEPATELQTPFDEPQSKGPAFEPEANVGEQAPDVAPEAAPAKTKATRVKKTSTGGANAGAPREGSKKDQILTLISRKDGATLEEIMTATGLQKHTVRGFIAILGKKGTKIESFKNEAGARTYKAA